VAHKTALNSSDDLPSYPPVTAALMTSIGGERVNIPLIKQLTAAANAEGD